MDLPNDFGRRLEKLQVRWAGQRPSSESFLALEISFLYRTGALSEAAAGGLRSTTWTRRRDGQVDGSIVVRCGVDEIELIYRVREPRADEWEELEELVSIEWTPCNFGGWRPWFRCPSCDRRAGKLYGGRRFLCRHCCGFAYESTRESATYRLMHRAQNIRRQLGGDGNLLDLFPEKPKGMHWKTYERLRELSERAAHESMRLALERFR
jgi:hypothetical protein